VALTRSVSTSNPVGFRAVKIITAAAALPLVLHERRYATHPVLTRSSARNAARTC
jgi:hypothetical protein